ncbi:Uma2 family endonuclease [Chloroflexi bacterium TSY]|nr:Uma2 family endonuclease [Chloroflexi bacterium TSY]
MSSSSNGTPPLLPGDFLTRSEFERRYHAHPEIKKAELIEGIVYMPSPVNAKLHGDPHFDLITWLGVYGASITGLRGSDNATLRLDNLNDPQPDALLRLEPAQGGQSRLDEDGYLEGPVEFVLEIAASSVSYDMNQKKQVYARHGIQEYLVVLTHEQRVVWFVLRDSGYEELLPNDDGILRSEIFPGLWLQPSAIWDHDLATILKIVQRGIASPEHALYVQSLAEHR